MAFSFGGSAPTPAATAPSAFSFGSTPAPAPSTGGGFSFGAKSSAPAFGATAATPASAFGAPPAPAFGAKPVFGTSPAPASGSVFGAATAPASGGLFGKTPAPGGSLFGTTPAPAFGAAPTTFGAAPAPAFGGFGAAPAPAFGAAPGPQPPQAPPVVISAQTPYQNLPPEAKRAIDTLHEHYLRHKRTMLAVETMVPSLLRQNNDAPADAAAGGTKEPLPQQLEKLSTHVEELQAKVQSCGSLAQALKGQFEQATVQSLSNGVWPLEALAVRRRVKLTDSQRVTRKTDPTIQEKLREELDKQAAHVDRLEQIPSPYLVQTLEDLEWRIRETRYQLTSLSHQVSVFKKVGEEGIAAVVQEQMNALYQIADHIGMVHSYTETMREKYRSWETSGDNVLDKALIEDLKSQQRLDEQVKIEIMKAAPAAPPQPPAPAPGAFGTPAPATGLFGAPSPAPATGLFGAPAPAPGGGLFGAKAPAPGGSLFGAPAPAPSGGLFGAPAAAPAPATSAFSFGSTPAPAAPTFGAPAPAGGLFGTPAAAPAPAFGGFNTATTTPKTKSKGRSSRRR